MNIGEEQAPVEYPIPADPNQVPIIEPMPVPEPAEAPVPEHADACWCGVNHPAKFTHKSGAAMAYPEAAK